ncbi:hypothetical protein L210DRAFT_3652909 [Boletus edulis BED1]|uniref:Tyr recombinase domain-containing protein n=1 Tax=Boletus edulis BED1 TaxID=1328754 RepID=A0AAD4G7G6_BOLED|nr:hypothetical protein L210DRAFT_3652909 [Boletus edulis BED1]
MSLVIWIAIYVKFLAHLKAYVDDSYSFERADNMKFYPPYNKWFPRKQTDLLLLWDGIGLPHDEPKQVFGDTLEVIGFIVGPNAMSVLFPEDKRAELLVRIRTFAVVGKRWPLREVLRIAGWCNWAFNVFYLLPPGLSALYEKVSGKTNMFAGVSVNTTVVRELGWLAVTWNTCPGSVFSTHVLGNLQTLKSPSFSLTLLHPATLTCAWYTWQHRDNPVVKRTLAGRLRRARQQPSRKPPLDLTILHRVLHPPMQSALHDDLLFAALLASGFYALMRLVDAASFSFNLPTHKTLKVGHGNTIMVRSFHGGVDPLPVIDQYIHSRDHLFYFSPELWLTSERRIPTRAWFTRRLHNACGSEFTGHSMRAGGATALAMAGTPPHVIQAIGRWSSDEWQKYVRKHPYLQQALLHGSPPASA